MMPIAINYILFFSARGDPKPVYSEERVLYPYVKTDAKTRAVYKRVGFGDKTLPQIKKCAR
jgi:hypothetical protein